MQLLQESNHRLTGTVINLLDVSSVEICDPQRENGSEDEIISLVALISVSFPFH